MLMALFPLFLRTFRIYLLSVTQTPSVVKDHAISSKVPDHLQNGPCDEAKMMFGHVNTGATIK